MRANFLRLLLCLFFALFFTPSIFSQDNATLMKEIETVKAELKELKARTLTCVEGKSVQAGVNKWSPWSTCPQGYVATGLMRVDIQGNHDLPTNHVNDFVCGEQGCRAWCIGNSCEVQARCCR